MLARYISQDVEKSQRLRLLHEGHSHRRYSMFIFINKNKQNLACCVPLECVYWHSVKNILSRLGIAK